MASFLNKAHHHRCYFCRQAEANEAYAANICLRHEALISLRLLVLLARRGRFGTFRSLLWPRLQRITHCPWCWQDAGITRDFPAPWSSTICTYHDRRVRAQARARRRSLQLLTTPTVKTTAAVLAEEVLV
jgi:hypothetical protein